MYCINRLFIQSFILELSLFLEKNVEECRCNKEVSDVLVTEDRSSKVSPEQSMSESEVLFDCEGASSITDPSLLRSPEPSNHSLTFVTPSSGIFTTPQSSLPKPTAHDERFPGNEPNHTPFGTTATGDDTLEEKPPHDEKHVTSTPYLGLGSLKDLIGKRFHAGSRLGAWSEAVTLGVSFMDEIGMDFVEQILAGLDVT